MGTNITGIGNANAIGFKSRVTGGIYFPPELKDALVGVWSAYGKSNDSTDRNIIKNKIKDRGGDFVISNAAFKLNSGFGKYETDFTTWIQTNGVIASSDKVQNSITGRFLYFNTVNKKEDVPSFKVNITLGQQSKLQYNYIKEDGTSTYIVYSESGIYTIPASYFSKYTGGNAWFGFYQIEGTSIIEQIPSFEGAFVTDGINDLITSTKTVQEMLGGSNEITVVSMMANLDSRQILCNSNFSNTNGYNVRNTLEPNGVISMLGYTDKNGTTNNLNLIMGDKDSIKLTDKVNFNSDYVFYPAQYYKSYYQVAWYWTIIANKVLTTDQINQVIAYYNLDRCVEPTVLYDVKRQGLSNDTPDSDWYLKDFSKNGFDMSLFNFAKKGNSGVGKYETDFLDSSIWKYKTNSSVTSDKIVCNKAATHIMLLYYSITDGNKYDVPSFNVLKQGDASEYYYIDEQGIRRTFKLLDGINTLPASHGTLFTGTEVTCGFGNPGIGNSVTITQIPSHAGALCFDGVDDYGQFVGDLGLKDYTVVIDRAYPIVSTPQFTATSDAAGENANTPFLIEHRDVNANEFTYSYLSDTAISINKEREICYQSTYQYKDTVINRGSSTSLGTGLTIARYGINNGYSALALYSFMLFHYSMSKFLIERQLKKHKLGTLYPNMVEFRPIIKSNIDILKINYWDKDLNVVKAGDYISIGSNIKTSITVLDGYKISKVSSTAFNNITIEKSNTDFIYDVIFYGIKKSPQKINLVIEQDSDYVQWNPNIKANVSKYSVTANIRETDGTTLKLVNGQFYSTSITGNLILDIVPPYKDSDEVTNVVIDGKSYTPTKDSSGNYYRLEIPLVFPKEINITIQEYVRYEDIVQPYPVLLKFKDENNNEISWGDKIKLGSSITRIGSFNDCNLLKDIYTVSNAKLNGSPLPSTPHVVERQMVFTCTATWIFDNNEPKCILSPRLLRIPNSSYKILGHIPDISGHGNHGKINNSAYASMSGANGYLLDFKTFTTGNSSLVNIKDDSRIEVININKEKSTTFVNLNKSTSISLSSWKIKVTGMKSGDTLGYYYSESTDATLRSKFDIKSDGIYSLPSSIANSNNIGGIAFDVVAGADSAYRIEQIGEYESAYCLDGVDDFVTIPTLSSGGKQVLMKVNWQKQDTMLYNQNPGQDNFAIFTNNYNNNNLVVAYASRNNGNTYIDGVVNNNILATQLKGITHNIVATNNNIDATITPIIGSNKNHDNFFAQMSLYDFMLFDEISTDDKIKELNTYIGITPKVTLPNYYWDNYGKKNTDAKRGYIDEQVSLQKTGTSVNPLENFNISYEGMSGYNGYPVVFGANKTWETSNAVDYIYDINSTIVHITNVKHAANGLLYSYVKRDGALANIKEIPAFRVTVKGLEENSKLIYKYLATENATKESIVYLGNGIHKLPKSFVPTDALLDLTTNSWIGFAITPMIEGELVFDCDITIEILPEYENGLVYDGVSDFTDNKNIPILTDFTFIIKREILGLETNGSMLVIKGDKVYNNGIGNAFILEYNSNGVNYYVYSYGKLNQIKRDDSKIIYLTPESYNGNPIIKGENGDNLRLILSRHWKGIIYKTILYSKTISLLEINFLKNLMEKDEIIDINHPIFISNTEDESNASQDT